MLFEKLRELVMNGFTLFVPSEGATINDFEVDEKTFAGFYQKTEVDKVMEQLPKIFEVLDLYEEALSKIEDPRKRDHQEPDAYTALGCLENMAFEALNRAKEIESSG